MLLQINNIIPKWIDASRINASEIWGKLYSFEEGKKYAIIAPSGSGKTTFIQALYGLRNDFEGTVTLDNEQIKLESEELIASIRSQKISIVFQDLRLFPQLTALENIEIKKQLSFFDNSACVEEMFNNLGIAAKQQQLAGTCSFGEQQRIAIVRALQQPFNFILLDEPFSHLDDDNAKKALHLIEAEAAKRNAAIILVDLQPIPFFKPDISLQL
jgi:ABC-type lipoprotein export system ATPase subunit